MKTLRPQPWKGFVGVALGFNRVRCSASAQQETPPGIEMPGYANKVPSGLGMTPSRPQPWKGFVGVALGFNRVRNWMHMCPSTPPGIEMPGYANKVLPGLRLVAE